MVVQNDWLHTWCLLFRYFFRRVFLFPFTFADHHHSMHAQALFHVTISKYLFFSIWFRSLAEKWSFCRINEFISILFYIQLERRTPNNDTPLNEFVLNVVNNVKWFASNNIRMNTQTFNLWANRVGYSTINISVTENVKKKNNNFHMLLAIQ